jgi:hypothetical protein
MLNYDLLGIVVENMMRHSKTEMRGLKLSASIMCVNLMNLDVDIRALQQKG